jgi:hypothetical protein
MKAQLHYLKSLILLACLAAILAACNASAPQPTDVPPDVQHTAAVQTVAAIQTANALLPTPTTQPPQEQPTDTPSPEALPATETPTQLPEPTQTPQPSATPEPTQPPTVTPTLTPQSAANFTLSRKDDFEHGVFWYTFSSNDYTLEVANGKYHVINNLLGAIIWSTQNDDLADARLEVDVWRDGGPDDGLFGVTCRYQDGNNYYALMVSPNGFYGILRMKDGVETYLAQGTAEKGIIITRGDPNHLRADCVGQTLALYVNDKKLAEAQDISFTSGNVGLVVGNRITEAGTDVRFDNFAIWKP